MNSLRDEFSFMLSDRGGKYYISAFVVVIAVLLVFSQILVHNQIENGKIVVIDMDNSAFSKQLIDKFNSSQYIKVEAVLHTAVNPEEILYHDKYLGVIYLPHNLEKNKYKSLSNHIGLFLDNTNTAAVVNLRATVKEIIGKENLAISFPKVKQLGLSDEQAVGTIANIGVEERILFNPVGNYGNTTIMGFLNMYSAIFYSFAVLPIIARLRMTKKWEEVILCGNPLSLMQRIIPYAVVSSVALFLGFGLLKAELGFRFAGNVGWFFLSIILYTLSNGLLCMLVSWGAKNPGDAMSKMIFVVVPGFILGGVSLPIAVFPEWIRVASNLFPMTWLFRFVRDIGLRGADITYMWREFGEFVIYIGIIVAMVILKFYQERMRIQAYIVKENLSVGKIEIKS